MQKIKFFPVLEHLGYPRPPVLVPRFARFHILWLTDTHHAAIYIKMGNGPPQSTES